jgi:cytochrome c-type biogenesis protein CcmE
MTPEATRRWALGVVLVICLGAMGGLYFFARGNLVYYWTPTEMKEALDRSTRDDFRAVIRLGAVVKEGTLKWDKEQQQITFLATDGTTDVAVHATGAPPAMFREGIGVVVEGRMGSGDVFESDRLMVKHSNEYKVPDAESGDPMAVYRTVEDM